MGAGEQDPELAARSVRELAALTGVELTADIRAAACDVLDQVDLLRPARLVRDSRRLVAHDLADRDVLGDLA